MRYRALPAEWQYQDYFTRAAAAIPIYWPKAAWTQQLFRFSVCVGLFTTVLFAFCFGFTAGWAFWLTPLLLLPQVVWIVWVDKRASVQMYVEQDLVDLYFALPKEVRKERINPTLRNLRKYISDQEINLKTGELIQQYAEFYQAKSKQDTQRQQALDLIQKELDVLRIAKQEFGQVRITDD